MATLQQTEHNKTVDAKNFSRRAALGGLLFPAVGLFLGGCTRGLTTAAAPKVAIPEGRGAFALRADGTRAFRNHELVDQNGVKVRFQDDLVEGKVFGATFQYAKCEGICSDMTQQMKKSYQLMKPIMGKPVNFYMFSLAGDSPAEMKAFMQAHGIDNLPSWRFFTGSSEAIADIRWAFGFGDPNEETDKNLAGHTGMVRFGNHKLDRWSSCPALSNPVVTARSVISLYPPGQRPHIAALERVEPHPARAIPGYQPVGPSSQAPSQASSQASPL